MSDLRAAAQRYIDRLTEYRRLSMEAHVWAGSDETMWEGSADLRAALSGVPEGAARPTYAEHVAHAARCPQCLLDAVKESVPSPEEPLDVERLAAALHAMPHHYRGGADNDLARMACEQMSPSVCEHKAASIAREYARFAAPQPVPEDET